MSFGSCTKINTYNVESHFCWQFKYIYTNNINNSSACWLCCTGRQLQLQLGNASNSHWQSHSLSLHSLHSLHSPPSLPRWVLCWLSCSGAGSGCCCCCCWCWRGDHGGADLTCLGVRLLCCNCQHCCCCCCSSCSWVAVVVAAPRNPPRHWKQPQHKTILFTQCENVSLCCCC